MKSNDINFSKSALISLNIYVGLLVKWQDKINLVSKNSLKDCVQRYVKSIDNVLLKIMSKMGISVLRAYRGGCNF